MQKMSEKDKITIDEIIEHCNKTCEMAEMYAIKQGKTQDDITAKSYWEHYQVLKYIEELKQYRAIGTVEECREAVERMKPKKPIMRYGCIYRCPPDCGGKEFDEYGDVPHCPTCNRVLHSLDDICKCGQKIDWSE